MRHPVSTAKGSSGDFGGADVENRVVVGVVLPGTPEDADPCAGEDSGGVLVGAPACFGAIVDVGCPSGGMPGVVGEADDGLWETMVACPSEDDAAGFAGSVSDGADAGLGCELVFGLEALANIAELGEDLGGADAAGTREGHDDPAVGELGDGVFDARGERSDLVDKAVEQGGECADELTLGVGFGFLGEAGWGGAQPGEEFGGRATAGVAMLGEEAGEAFLAEAAGAVGCGIAADEGECDRAVDGGEDMGGAGPEAVEQAAQLVGERGALGDEIVAAAHERAQGSDIVGGRHERSEAMPVGTQDVGEHIGIAGIGLAAGGAVARAAGFDDVRMDRDHRMTGFDQRVDEQAGGPLDGNGQFGRRRELAQGRQQRGEAGRVVADLLARDDLAGAVDNADGMACAAPIQSSVKGHMPISLGWCRLTRAGRSCGSLTDRRSGRQALALHPVVRCGLPAPAARQVSCGPSSGERAWPSRQMLGLLNATPLRGFASNSQEVLQ